MQGYRQFLAIGLAAALAVGVARAQSPVDPNDPSTVPRVTLDAFKAMNDKGRTLVVDVRGADSFKLGHIPGAISIPFGEIEQHAATVRSKAKQRPIVLYCSCAGEHLSVEGALALAKNGVRNVHALVGGYPAWVLDGGKVERAKAGSKK